MDKSSQKHYLKPVFPQWPPSESQAWPHVVKTESHGIEASAYISNGIALASLRSRICSDAVYGDVYHPPASRSYPAVSSLNPQDALTPGQQKVWQDIDNILERRHAEAMLRKPKKKPQPAKAQDQRSAALSTSAKPQDTTPAERQETSAVEPGHKAATQLADETIAVSQTPERGEADEDIASKAAPKSSRRLRSQRRIATNKFYAQNDLKATQLVAAPQVDDDESGWGIGGLFGLTSENSETQQPTQDDGGGWSLARNVGGLLFGGGDNTGAENENETKEGIGSSTVSAAKQVGATVASTVTNTGTVAKQAVTTGVVNTGSAAKQAGTAVVTGVANTGSAAKKAAANTGSAAKQAGAAVASGVANTTGRIFRKPFGGKTEAELSGEETAAPENAETNSPDPTGVDSF